MLLLFFLRKGAVSVTHPMLFSELAMWVISNIDQKVNDTIVTPSLVNSSKLSERTRNLSWRKSKVITRTVCTTPLDNSRDAGHEAILCSHQLAPSKLYPHNKLLVIISRVSQSNTCSQLCKS